MAIFARQSDIAMFKIKHVLFSASAVLLFACGGDKTPKLEENLTQPLFMNGEIHQSGNQYNFIECGTNQTFSFQENLIDKALSDLLKTSGVIYLEAEMDIDFETKVISNFKPLLSDADQRCVQVGEEFKPGIYILHSTDTTAMDGSSGILEFQEDGSVLMSSGSSQKNALTGKWSKTDEKNISITWESAAAPSNLLLKIEADKLIASDEASGQLHYDYNGPSRKSLIEQALYDELADISSIRGGSPVTRDQLSTETSLADLMTNEIQWKSFNNYLSFFFKLDAAELQSFRKSGMKIGNVRDAIYSAMLEKGALVKKVVIGPEPGSCGSEELECLQVYEGNWTNLGQPIENFLYEPGAMYQILVTEEKSGTDENGKPIVKRSLIKQMEVKEMASDFRLHDVWALKILRGTPVKGLAFREHPYIELHLEEGKVNGHTGCNRLFGDFNLDAKKLKFGTIATTRMMCEEIAKFEADMLAALAEVSSYKFEGNDLHLLAGEQVIMVLRKVD
jgi:heat shock protein HslJ